MLPHAPGRRRLLTLAAGGLAALAGAAPVPALARPERSRVVLAVAGRMSLAHLPLTLALYLGHFRTEGLEVELQEHPSAASALQALASGSADVAGLNWDQLLRAPGRALGLQSFVVYGRAPQVALGVSTRSLPGLRALAELRGHTLGVESPDSASGLVAALALRQAGIRPDDVTLLNLASPAAALAALRAGQVDAVCHAEPAMTALEQRTEVRIVADTRSLRGTQDLFGGLVPTGCLLAPAGFLARSPLTTQALADAVVHALKWLQTAGPSDLIKAVPEPYFQGDRALYLAAFGKVRETLSHDGELPEGGARTALRALAAVDPEVRLASISLGALHSPEFGRRAKARFGA